MLPSLRAPLFVLVDRTADIVPAKNSENCRATGTPQQSDRGLEKEARQFRRATKQRSKSLLSPTNFRCRARPAVNVWSICVVSRSRKTGPTPEELTEAEFSTWGRTPNISLHEKRVSPSPKILRADGFSLSVDPETGSAREPATSPPHELERAHRRSPHLLAFGLMPYACPAAPRMAGRRAHCDSAGPGPRAAGSAVPLAFHHHLHSA